jgi:hypothetical protein
MRPKLICSACPLHAQMAARQADSGKQALDEEIESSCLRGAHNSDALELRFVQDA